MPPIGKDVQQGVYARKQLLSSSRLVAFSHSRRFQLALKLAAQADGRRLLDYGSGDGSFLAMLLASGIRPAEAVGAELALDLVADCRERLRSTGVDFIGLEELDRRPPASFDMLFCMEVLEHIPDIEPVIDRFDRLLAADGHLIISVPVETGLPLLVKQAARTIAGWRGIGDYPGTESYRIWEWLPSIFAGPNPHLHRKIHFHGDGPGFHDHKGFNWMALRERLRRTFEVHRILSSPFTSLPPHLGTQAWFIAKRRPVVTVK